MRISRTVFCLPALFFILRNAVWRYGLLKCDLLHLAQDLLKQMILSGLGCHFSPQGWPLLWCQLVNPVYYRCIYLEVVGIQFLPPLCEEHPIHWSQHPFIIFGVSRGYYSYSSFTTTTTLMLIPARAAKFNNSVKIIQWLGINKPDSKKSYLDSTLEKADLLIEHDWFFLFSPVSLTNFTALLHKHMIRKARKVCRNFNLACHKCRSLTDVISCVSYSH